MADKKETQPVDPKNPPPWDGTVRTEQYCGKCGGYVNGNGCVEDTCPVRPK